MYGGAGAVQRPQDGRRVEKLLQTAVLNQGPSSLGEEGRVRCYGNGLVHSSSEQSEEGLYQRGWSAWNMQIDRRKGAAKSCLSLERAVL
ncbi:hypothetical protein SRHO_G00173500 [Serrasalmus rhombeus]